MPVDEIAGEVVGFVARQVAGLAVDLVVDQIFSRYTARFFHGVGRRVIAIATFGFKRIPSSLRVVPAGCKARPTVADWLALFVGIVVWAALALVIGGTIWALGHGQALPWRWG